MEVMSSKEASEVAATLNDKEVFMMKTIYSMCENLVRLEDAEGDFDYSYAGQNTCITELTMEIIVQCRNQIQFQKQIKEV